MTNFVEEELEEDRSLFSFFFFKMGSVYICARFSNNTGAIF